MILKEMVRLRIKFTFVYFLVGRKALSVDSESRVQFVADLCDTLWLVMNLRTLRRVVEGLSLSNLRSGVEPISLCLTWFMH